MVNKTLRKQFLLNYSRQRIVEKMIKLEDELAIAESIIQNQTKEIDRLNVLLTKITNGIKATRSNNKGRV